MITRLVWPSTLIRECRTIAFWWLLCSTTMLVVLTPCTASAMPSRKPMHAKWELVAQSDLVARAKLHIPLQALKETSGAEKYARIDLQAEIEETVKGEPHSRTVLIGYYREDPPGSAPSPTFLEEHDGQEVILFLAQHGEASAAEPYFFTGFTPDALSSFNAEDLSAIASEVKNQQEIAEHFDSLPIGQKNAKDEKVRALLGGLTQRQTQVASWEKLLKLTRRDVPGIVRVMNDRRKVPNFDAYVPNKSPDAFEDNAHYGPTCIVEAASTILHHITRNWFRAVYNGASERERIEDINAWRCWCAYNF